MKKCSGCKNIKQYSDFFKKKQSKDGFDFWCKQCWSGKRNSDKQKRRNHKDSDYFTADQLSNMIGNCKKRANIKSLEFELNTFVLGDLLNVFCEKNYHSWEPGNPFKPSVDRIDSKRGYVLNNIQIVWSIENVCKNIYSNDDVIKFCKLKLGLDK